MAYRISELASAVGLSRSALLYYEKLQLIKGKRDEHNGYRFYSEHDIQRVHLIQLLQAGGLTLKECQACVDAKIDKQQLIDRLHALDADIEKKQQARQLLLAMLGQGKMTAWHEHADKLAPDVHLEWLIKQGFTEKEALRLKWLSKDMNEHQQYMAEFMHIISPLARWGPGSTADTLRAFSMLPAHPNTLLEIGCGNGVTTEVLAKQESIVVNAVDNDASALKRLQLRLQQNGLQHRVNAICASMTSLPFAHSSVELIWAEGSAYIIGVTNALALWRPLLMTQGCLVMSDLVWFTDSPSDESAAFWAKEYPDMQLLDRRLQQIEMAGYTVLAHFSLSAKAWANYYDPLSERVETLAESMADSAALSDIQKEIAIYQHGLGEFGYQMFVLQRAS